MKTKHLPALLHIARTFLDDLKDRPDPTGCENDMINFVVGTIKAVEKEIQEHEAEMGDEPGPPQEPQVLVTPNAKAFLGVDHAPAAAEKTVADGEILPDDAVGRAVFYAMRARYHFACQQISFSKDGILERCVMIDLIADVFEKDVSQVETDVRKFREGRR